MIRFGGSRREYDVARFDTRQRRDVRARLFDGTPRRPPFGMRTPKRLTQLERENARLKKLLAEAELEKAILKELAEGNF